MQAKRESGKWVRWLLPVVLVVCALQLMQSLFSLRSVNVQTLQGENGLVDLRQAELSTGVFQLDGGPVDRETPENLKTIQQEAQRLAEMVTSLMDYSYGRKGELRFERVDVPELLNRVLAITVPMCLKKRNTVRLAGVCSESAHGSFEMLLQVFINLVMNASRHTENGTITLSADGASQPGFVLFQVEDTGSGIAPKDLPHIFEQGFSAGGSTGLGLTICREVVESHGGRIWVERTSPRGTVIAFTVKKEEEQ